MPKLLDDIVRVAADESGQHLKGPGWPINCLKDFVTYDTTP